MRPSIFFVLNSSRYLYSIAGVIIGGEEGRCILMLKGRLGDPVYDFIKARMITIRQNHTDRIGFPANEVDCGSIWCVI